VLRAVLSATVNPLYDLSCVLPRSLNCASFARKCNTSHAPRSTLPEDLLEPSPDESSRSAA